MRNIMRLRHYSAKIWYESRHDRFKGEILGIVGHAEFHGDSVESLKKAFAQSLDTYLRQCKEAGIKPGKKKTWSETLTEKKY